VKCEDNIKIISLPSQPSPATERLIKQEARYGAHNYHPLPVALKRGEGSNLRNFTLNKINLRY